MVKVHAFLDGNKRTGTLVAITFMNENGWDLKYSLTEKNGRSVLGNTIDTCAAGKITKDELIDWFDKHKKKIL